MRKSWFVEMGVWVATMAVLAGPAARAGEVATSDRIAELERKVDALSREVERERLGDVFLPIGDSAHGLGPAASKIYHKEDGLSIGGYGEALYQNFEGDKPATADLLRAVLYFGYKFDERWVLNTEFEFEHASTGESGSVSAEFVTLDYLASPAVNFRAGLLLVPMGFINEMHEPTTYLGARRPDIERMILPSTWRELGAGVFGESGGWAYKAYLVNGLRADRFSPTGVRNGRQKGSETLAEDWAGVARLDWVGWPSLTLGGSLYYGPSGQTLDVDVPTIIAELHAAWTWRGIEARALGVLAKLDDVAELNRVIAAGEEPVPDADIESIGERMTGGYVELGYNVLEEFSTGAAQVVPFARYERYDTQDHIPSGFSASGRNDVTVWTLGVNVRPREWIVFKADYMIYDRAAGPSPNQFNLAMGYMF